METFDHLPLFTIHNLAMVSDWLKENDTLCVDLYLDESAASISRIYFIRSIRDLKYLLWEFCFWSDISVTIYRHSQFSFYGTANGDFLETVLRQFSENQIFFIVDYECYPSLAADIILRRGHAALLTELADRWGHSIAIGHERLYKASKDKYPGDILSVGRNQYNEGYKDNIKRSQNAYAPYDVDPARYQWIVEMWREQNPYGSGL